MTQKYRFSIIFVKFRNKITADISEILNKDILISGVPEIIFFNNLNLFVKQIHEMMNCLSALLISFYLINFELMACLQRRLRD